MPKPLYPILTKRIPCSPSLWGLSSLLLTASAPAASVVFDDFNTNEGHFASAPTASGSNSNISATSTADRVTGTALEGSGNERIVIVPTTNAVATRLRFLSGGGTIANNTPFTTSGGVDGWIGFYARTSASGWTAQIWIEGPENNGGVPKSVIADGNWHLYEWNLDDQSGGANGWGQITGIIAGDADVQDGSYTIDSLIFRHAGPSGSSTMDIDFVAKSDSGSVAGLLIPEPSSAALLGLGLLGFCRRRR